jgi:hypothetical protein
LGFVVFPALCAKEKMLRNSKRENDKFFMVDYFYRL